MDKIAVIGGGASGIIAAGTAASLGKDVTLFDKNEKIGKKIYITGKGRCNITNDSDIDNYLMNIVNNKEFLYSSLYTFNSDSIIYLLNNEGIKTKVERGNRVFPESDKSSDVIKGFNSFLNKNNVKLKLNTQIDKIEKSKKGFNLFVGKEILYFDKVIITTGGKSYKATGSTGDGYIFAEKLGHTIIEAKPALCPINLKNHDTDLQGLSLKNVELKLYEKNKLLKSIFGEMLFTHFGISGPIVLSMSSYLTMIENKNDIRLTIDLKPKLSYEKLDNRILKDFELNNNKILGNSLDKLLPKKMIEPIIKKSANDYNKTVHQITKDERKKLVETFKDYPLKFKEIRPLNEAIITSGGVSTKEINPSTMESKLVENLFFAGEVIDVDALTGGYNLQIAYSTGYLAGLNI